MTDWETLIYDRPDNDILAAIYDTIERGDVADGLAGLEEFMGLMSKRERQRLESNLIIVMVHIIKWRTQAYRTRSWALTIAEHLDRIEDDREDYPRFTREYIETELWPKCMRRALKKAEREMGVAPAVTDLSWEDVFETEYRLD